MNAKPAPVLEPPGAPPAPPPAPPKKGGRFRLDNRFLAPILITAIVAVGHFTYGITEDHASPLLARLTSGRVTTYSPTFVAILTAILAELVIGRIVVGKWPHLASAYISGISVGILIRSPELWPYILCSLITIVSKYAIRVRGRHLWNPSNLGVSAMLFLAPATVAGLSLQWSNQLWPLLVIWVLGTLILYRLGRLHITLTYAAAFVVLAFVRSAVTGDPWLTEVAPITGPMYQLFIFFMITDPKTTTRARWSQCAVAVLVAIVEMIFRLNRVVHAPYYALFVVGPVTNAIEIWWESRKATKTSPRPVAT
ncbi:MAG TPA: hypothetical protein VG013_42215 [Gemmataceae bacterium]|jgi:hypothetical protein|nr:hypothetical protein [Gemmataceae bacterium]